MRIFTFGLIQMLVLCFALTSQAQNSVEKLIAYYPFTGNTRDYSGNNYHATNLGATLTTDRFNNPNSAYYFDGYNSYVRLPSPFDLLPKTISFWFNAYTISWTNRVMYVSDNPGLQYGITSITLETINGIPSLNTHINSSRDTVVVSPNTWHFFCVTIGRDSTHVYLDGNLVKSRKVTGYPKSYTGIPYTVVGSHRQGDTPSTGFHGKIDEVKIYNTELTPQQVKESYSPVTLDLGNDLCLNDGEKVELKAPGFSEYTWSNGSHASSITIDQPGTYSLTVKDQYGRELKDAITVSNCPELELGPDKCIAEGQRLELNISGFESYLWSNGSESSSISITQPGTYQVIATDRFGNMRTDAITITACKALDLGGDNCIDPGGSLELKAAGFENYTWNNGSHAPSIIVSQPGKYQLTVTDKYGRQLQDEVTISLCSQLELGPDNCLEAGQRLTLKAEGFAKYTWSNGSITPSIQITQPGMYQLTAIDNFGNTKIDAVTITACPQLNLTNPVSDFTCLSQDQEIKLEVDGFESYLWSDGSTQKSILIRQPGIYSLTATDSFGNVKRSEINIPGCPNFKIPNIITPNQDHLNDYFFIEQIGTRYQIELSIFNRWGKMVYQVYDYQDNWKADHLSSGTYFYEVKVMATKQVYKGWVEVVK